VTRLELSDYGPERLAILPFDPYNYPLIFDPKDEIKP
jgi:hypothetical protein